MVNRVVGLAMKANPIRDLVAEDTVRSHIYQWLISRHASQTTLDVSDYILRESEQLIRPCEIWIPIIDLHLESPLSIGRVRLQEIQEEEIQKWSEHYRCEADSPTDPRQELLGRKGKIIQGHTASVFCATADPRRAEELALTETEQALAVILLFDPVLRSPRHTTACRILGRDQRPHNALLLVEGGLLTQWHEEVTNNQGAPLALGNAQIENIRATGLGRVHEILIAPKRTGFEGRVLTSLRMFSRVAQVPDQSDKMVYLLSAMESLLLLNDTESIQQNLGERLALLVGQNLQERRDICDLTRKLYRMRSRFVHHAEHLTDYALLERYMEYAWLGQITALRNTAAFADHREFLRAIDDKKLS